jgi:hypothetical protein
VKIWYKFINFIKTRKTMAKSNQQKIKEYRLIYKEGLSYELTASELQFEVNKLINEKGFQPFGDPVIGSDSKVLQAVVLYATE